MTKVNMVQSLSFAMCVTIPNMDAGMLCYISQTEQCTTPTDDSSRFTVHNGKGIPGNKYISMEQQSRGASSHGVAVNKLSNPKPYMKSDDSIGI